MKHEMNATQDNQTLTKQHEDLTGIHQEILDHIDNLEKYFDSLSVEAAQDFDRIFKAISF